MNTKPIKINSPVGHQEGQTNKEIKVIKSRRIMDLLMNMARKLQVQSMEEMEIRVKRTLIQNMVTKIMAKKMNMVAGNQIVKLIATNQRIEVLVIAPHHQQENLIVAVIIPREKMRKPVLYPGMR